MKVHTVDCPKRQPGYQATLQGFWDRHDDDDLNDADDDIDEDDVVGFDDIGSGDIGQGSNSFIVTVWSQLHAIWLLQYVCYSMDATIWFLQYYC